jgi:S1-C subfamily serine protease
VQSLLLALQVSPTDTISTGTGFVVRSDSKPYLITNYHVVAGRHPDTRQPIDANASIPDRVVIYHNAAGQLGAWMPRTEMLVDVHGRPNWLELPSVGGRTIDVVALPLTETEGIDLHPYDQLGPKQLIIQPTEQVSIIGFPFGRAAGGIFAIWTQGTIASEPDIDFDDLPVLLVDSRTRPGQSGSPVVAHRAAGSYATRDGFVVGGQAITELVGIYSGRINDESDLGMVWKVEILDQLLAAGVRPT